MNQLLLGIATALWLGLLTSISPCSLATNIAAISYVGRRVGNPRKVLLAGLLYTAGRILAFIALGVLLVSSLLSAPQVSHLLQKYMNKALGPVLIIVGMILCELIKFNWSGSTITQGMQKRLETLGIWGALLLGILFSLSFCPISAALFFGSLLPIALRCQSGLLLPAAFGMASGLPVIIFSLLISFGTKKVGTTYVGIVALEKWFRLITGILFILVGIYYCLVHAFGLLS
jgi:cytochrome c-type biogenesis protein